MPNIAMYMSANDETFSLTHKAFDYGANWTKRLIFLVVLPVHFPAEPPREWQNHKLSRLILSPQIQPLSKSQAGSRWRQTLRNRERVVHVEAHAYLPLDPPIRQSLTRFGWSLSGLHWVTSLLAERHMNLNRSQTLSDIVFTNGFDAS